MTDRAPSVVMATDRPGGPHLTVAGDVDAEGALRLQAQLDDLVGAGVELTLDLSRVTRLSAAALEVLVLAYRRLHDGGGTVTVGGASPAVVRVLRVSGLHRILPVVATPLPVLQTDTAALPS